MTGEADRPMAEPAPRPDLIETLRAMEPLAPADALPDDLDALLLPLRDAACLLPAPCRRLLPRFASDAIHLHRTMRHPSAGWDPR